MRRREEVHELVLVLGARADRAAFGPGQVDEAPDRDRQDVAVRLDPRLAADRAPVEADDPPERVADRVLDGDPDLATRDEDAVDQELRIAGVAGLVDGRHRRHARRDARRRVSEVRRQHLARPRVGLRHRFAPDQRVAGSQGGGVGGVLEEASLAVEAADVEREPGGGEQDGDGEREDHEDLAPLAAARTGRRHARELARIS